MMNENLNENSFVELNDEELEQVSGGTGVDEEEEELPGYDDAGIVLGCPSACSCGSTNISCEEYNP